MAGSVPATDYTKMTRKNFGDKFVFGIGTSAYQVEGAAAKGGRGISIWDDFSLGAPNKITDRSNGNVAVDMYHRYKEDIKMMKSMGFDAYRFSISWPRLIPSGKISLGVNREAVDYYNDLIDTVCKYGMQPHVTLFHWDLPDLLQKDYGGFLDKKIVDDYCDYVDICFWEFGDRVKHWATFNEPWTYCYRAYVARAMPPGAKVDHDASTAPSKRLSMAKRAAISEMDDNGPLPTLHDYRMGSSEISFFNRPTPKSYSGRSRRPRPRPTDDIESKEAFKAARNMILAHAEAVELYNTKFKPHQKEGQIGIVLNTHCFEAFDDTKQEDIDAARRVHDFKFGWFLEPILTGKYPKTMEENVPDEALFRPRDVELLTKNKIDFLGLNYYSARYIQHNPERDPSLGAFDNHQKARVHRFDKDGNSIGEQPGPSWLHVVPWGINKLLKKINEYYNNSTYKCPPIYITENGVAEPNIPGKTLVEATKDATRVNYYRDHLGNLLGVIKEWEPLEDQKKLKIKGYFAWSWVDNFEWLDGYSSRFGLIYIDYMNDLKRYPKLSAKWFSKFLGGVDVELLCGTDDGEVAMPPDFVWSSNGNDEDKPVDSTGSEPDAKGKITGRV